MPTDSIWVPSCIHRFALVELHSLHGGVPRLAPRCTRCGRPPYKVAGAPWNSPTPGCAHSWVSRFSVGIETLSDKLYSYKRCERCGAEDWRC